MSEQYMKRVHDHWSKHRGDAVVSGSDTLRAFSTRHGSLHFAIMAYELFLSEVKVAKAKVVDEPEEGKTYALHLLGKEKTWADTEVVQVPLTLGEQMEVQRLAKEEVRAQHPVPDSTDPSDDWVSHVAVKEEAPINLLDLF